MIGEQHILEFLNKKVFVKLIGEEAVQVGILRQKDGCFFLEGFTKKTLIDASQIARMTQEYDK